MRSRRSSRTAQIVVLDPVHAKEPDAWDTRATCASSDRSPAAHDDETVDALHPGARFVTYRCAFCHLDLVFDEDQGRFKLAPFGNWARRNRPRRGATDSEPLAITRI